jgi:molecular chaperone GrpE
MADNESKPTKGEAESIQESLAATAGDEIARLKAELEDVKDRALRGWAELENYRKRAARQIEDERRFAALPLARDLLPVLDNVKRAVDAAEKNHDTASLLEGIKMVVQQLEGVLVRHHCTPIAALHQPFDPNFHDAILHQPSAEFPPNTVIQEVQQGFRLHDRVVRPTQVIVSSPAGKPDGESPDAKDNKP